MRLRPCHKEAITFAVGVITIGICVLLADAYGLFDP